MSRRLPRHVTPALFAWLLTAPSCDQSAAVPRPPAGAKTALASTDHPVTAGITEAIFDGGLRGGWQDWGWAPRDDKPGGPARVRFSDWGGWILANPGFRGRHGALVFRYRAPGAHGDFLEAHVESADEKNFPRVRVSGPYLAPLAEGWMEARIPSHRLDPSKRGFDRIILSAAKQVGPEWVEIDKIGLAALAPTSPSLRRPAAFRIDCAAPTTRISPLIYGIAYDFMHDAEHQHQWQLGATARRWGGNPTSRYNWILGNAWNAAQDWYWENVDFGTKPGPVYQRFLDDDRAHGVRSALTIPMLGWVAKDITSFSFPVSTRGPQDAADPYKRDAGNGLAGRKPLAPPPPGTTSTAAPPEVIKRWIEAIREEDRRAGVRRVHQYILDNEPGLWNSTHRDVHPEPLTYDELLDRTIQYASVIRAADPDAVIAGPAEWGWAGYQYSAKDLAAPPGLRPDRRAHGGVPLLPWYLQKLREHEQRTGVRLLDVVDVHFYPQGKGVYGADDAGDAAALRLRSTRALWDPSYVDESWIAERIMLIPRLQQWIAESYPGRGLSIGEWNFGGERHMSGGLAVAEALGRFGQGGVTSAFYWVYPPAGSPAFWAFRAYRDFDGHGGRFLDESVPARASEETSIFASRDEARRHLVAVVLNFSPDAALDASIALHACGAASKASAFSYAEGLAGLTKTEASITTAGLAVPLAPYSINVIDVEIGEGR
ncbi:MAG: glycoside hydrolase family 44 protein [Minicystis sp.]